MTTTREPQIAVPDVDTPTNGDDPGYRRILVPVRLTDDALGPLAVVARVCRPANCTVRLVHVRIYDPPMRGPGRFYPQNRTETVAIPDDALPMAWGYGPRATAAVAEAPRRDVASVVARQAAAWRADLIVMTRRPGPAIYRLILGSVPDQVMRKAHSPVLVVRPDRKAPSRR